MSERGAISILAAAAIAVTLALGLMASTVSSLVVARSLAQTAADAAALAAAPVTFDGFGSDRSPEEEAAHFAAVNGARLEQCDCDRDEVWRSRIVVVSVVVDLPWLPAPLHGVRARAAAEFDPTVWLGMTPAGGR